MCTCDNVRHCVYTGECVCKCVSLCLGVCERVCGQECMTYHFYFQSTAFPTRRLPLFPVPRRIRPDSPVTPLPPPFAPPRRQDTADKFVLGRGFARDSTDFLLTPHHEISVTGKVKTYFSLRPGPDLCPDLAPGRLPVLSWLVHQCSSLHGCRKVGRSFLLTSVGGLEP